MRRSRENNRFRGILRKQAFWLVLALANLMLLGIIVFLVIQDFSVNTNSGIQSIAAVGVPLILLIFILLFGGQMTLPTSGPFRRLIDWLTAPFITFPVSAVWGFLLLTLLNTATKTAAEAGNSIPTPELLLSFTFFGLLIYGREDLRRGETEKVDAFYLGLVFGGLVYMMAVGLPF